MLLLLLGLLPPTAESSSSASASSGLSPCICCFSFFFSNEALFLVLDSGDKEEELFIISSPDCSLLLVGDGGFIREKFLGGDFLVDSSGGLRVRLGGDLFGSSDPRIPMGCGGGVLDCLGPATSNTGDPELSVAGAVNVGVVAIFGGRGGIPGDDGSGGGILSSVPALTCVDRGEGIRSTELEYSLDGAVS